MRLSFGDAIGSTIESMRGVRWTEYAPFFWILLLQLLFLVLCSQLHTSWGMGLVAPIARLVGGEGNLHYPVFFAYVSILFGWMEGFVYTVPGAVLIPLSLLRFYSRSDRALSLGAGAAARLAGAVLPTLVAGAVGIGAVLGWQTYLARSVSVFLREHAVAPFGPLLGWLAATLGGYVIVALLLYVPVAAVQARTNPIRAFAFGVRFGLRSWPLTVLYSVFFGAPAILIQFVLERQGSLLLTRLRPELSLIFLAVYAVVTSIATYLTYLTAARLYRIARGEE